jgi:hypothetical protein
MTQKRADIPGGAGKPALKYRASLFSANQIRDKTEVCLKAKS